MVVHTGYTVGWKISHKQISEMVRFGGMGIATFCSLQEKRGGSIDRSFDAVAMLSIHV